MLLCGILYDCRNLLGSKRRWRKKAKTIDDLKRSIKTSWRARSIPSFTGSECCTICIQHMLLELKGRTNLGKRGFKSCSGRSGGDNIRVKNWWRPMMKMEGRRHGLLVDMKVGHRHDPIGYQAGIHRRQLRSASSHPQIAHLSWCFHSNEHLDFRVSCL